MGRASGGCRLAGAYLCDVCIVSFHCCFVKSFRLEYRQMYGNNSDNRASRLTRLREHRKRRGLTQIELAKISDVGRATIAALEAGKRGAYRSTVRKLAKALKVKPHELEGK
jgi:DNA-binding XRE family transcriptional regulator